VKGGAQELAAPVKVVFTNNGKEITNVNGPVVQLGGRIQANGMATFNIPCKANGLPVTDLKITLGNPGAPRDPGTLYLSVFTNGFMSTEPLSNWCVDNGYRECSQIFLPHFYPIGFDDVYFGVNLPDLGTAGQNFVDSFSIGDTFTIDASGIVPELPMYTFSSTPLAYSPGSGWVGTPLAQGTQLQYAAFHGASGRTPGLVLQYTFEPEGNPPDDPTVPGGIKDRSSFNVYSDTGYNGTSLTPAATVFVNGPSRNPNGIHLIKDDTQFPGGSGILTGATTTTLGIDTGPFTVMAWVNRDNLSGDHMVFGTEAIPALHLGFRDTKVYFGFWGNDSDSAGFPANEWHHVAWRYDPSVNGGQQDIFIDGQSVNASGSHGPYGSNQELLIGRTPLNDGAFGGALSDVRVYNVALDAAGIGAIAACPP